MTSVSFKYVNKDILSFDLDNIRNRKLKNITNFFDQYYENFLVNNFHKHNSYYNSKIFEETEKKLPEEIVIKSSNDLTLTNNKNINNSEEWRRSHGNAHSNRFSSLKNINLENINKLDIAWTYEFSERGWDIQSNIIFADGKVFIPSTKKHVVALNAYNGKEVWSYKMSYVGSSPPTTYLHKNEQFVVVAATGSTSLSIDYPDKVESGNKIYAFKIK